MPNDIKTIKYTAIPSDMPEDEADKKLDDIKKHMENPSSKTILIATAPWCGHCKALKPVLGILQTKIKAMKGNGLITHIDDTHHDKLKDFAKVEINGFPSIIKMKGNKQTGTHREGRDIDSLVKMTKEHLSVPTGGSKSRKHKKRKSNKSMKKKKRKNRKKRKTHKKSSIRGFLDMFRKYNGNVSKLKKHYNKTKKSRK